MRPYINRMEHYPGILDNPRIRDDGGLIFMPKTTSEILTDIKTTDIIWHTDAYVKQLWFSQSEVDEIKRKEYMKGSDEQVRFSKNYFNKRLEQLRKDAYIMLDKQSDFILNDEFGKGYREAIKHIKTNLAKMFSVHGLVSEANAEGRTATVSPEGLNPSKPNNVQSVKGD